MKKKYYIVFDYSRGKGAGTQIIENVENNYIPTIETIMEWQKEIEKNFVDVIITNFIEIGFDNE